jgi:protein-disulfide isomerase
MGKDGLDSGRGRRDRVVTGAARRGRNRGFYLALTAIALGGIVTLGYVASRSKGQPPREVAYDPNAAKSEGYFLGSPNAPVQIVEFADFECPACAQFATITEPDVRSRIVQQGLANYRFYDFPLPQHRNSMAASLAAACANDQGKFWEMHDRIFMGQDEWNTQATSRPKGIFARYAREVGLNPDTWEQCFDSRKKLGAVEASRNEGIRRNIQQTPTFLINDQLFPGAPNYDQFKARVDAAARIARPGGATAPAASDSARPATTR